MIWRRRPRRDALAELRTGVDELRPTLDLLVTVLHRVEQRLDTLEARVDSPQRSGADVAGLSAQITSQGEAVAGIAEAITNDVWPILRAVATEEAANRRRLHAARAEARYDDAYTSPEPLVTITVVTQGRRESLFERAMPSLLSQTYERLEVIVIGDRVGPDLAGRVQALGDSRVRYATVNYGATHPDPVRQWLSAAALARNEGYRLATGNWTLDFDDDDALRPDAVERLLAHARATRAEVAYGDFAEHAPDGSVTTKGGEPPELGHTSLATALAHSSLLMFQRQVFAADLGMPGDWYRIECMLRAGVRFERLDAVVLDYFPSYLWEGPPG